MAYTKGHYFEFSFSFSCSTRFIAFAHNGSIFIASVSCSPFHFVSLHFTPSADLIQSFYFKNVSSYLSMFESSFLQQYLPGTHEKAQRCGAFVSSDRFFSVRNGTFCRRCTISTVCNVLYYAKEKQAIQVTRRNSFSFAFSVLVCIMSGVLFQNDCVYIMATIVRHFFRTHNMSMSVVHRNYFFFCLIISVT